MLVILLKKSKFDRKTSELENIISDHNHDTYITTPEFNALAARVFNARLIKKTDLMLNCRNIRNINSSRTKHLVAGN